MRCAFLSGRPAIAPNSALHCISWPQRQKLPLQQCRLSYVNFSGRYRVSSELFVPLVELRTREQLRANKLQRDWKWTPEIRLGVSDTNPPRRTSARPVARSWSSRGRIEQIESAAPRADQGICSADVVRKPASVGFSRS